MAEDVTTVLLQSLAQDLDDSLDYDQPLAPYRNQEPTNKHF